MRGVYRHQFAGSPRAVVGAGVFGTGWLANPVEEINDVDRDAHALEDQLRAQLSPPFEVAYATQQSLAPFAEDRRAMFYASTWRPWVEKWQAYRDDHTSLGATLKAAAGPVFGRDAYFDVQPWRDQLRAMWEAAKSAGYSLGGAAPKAGEKPIGERVEDAAKKAENWFEQLGTIGKYTLIGGLTLGGLLVLSSIAANLRANRDPMTPYLAVARSGGRAAALAAK